MLITPSNNGSLDQMTSRLVQPFSQGSYIYRNLQIQRFTMDQTIPKIVLSRGGSWSHLIHGFLWPTLVTQPKRHIHRFSHFVGLTNVINRQARTETDRPCISVCSYRPHLLLRCDLILTEFQQDRLQSNKYHVIVTTWWYKITTIQKLLFSTFS